jgi:hypothetical protein
MIIQERIILLREAGMYSFVQGRLEAGEGQIAPGPHLNRPPTWERESTIE